MEEFWDYLCSELDILQDSKKKDIIKEYGRRIAEQSYEEGKADALKDKK